MIMNKIVLRVRLVWMVFMLILFFTVDRGSSVGTATRYGWTVRGSNPGWGDIFCICPDRPWGTGYFPGVKRLGNGLDHQLHLAPSLKKE